MVSKMILSTILRSMRVPVAVEERPLAFATVRGMMESIQRDNGHLSAIPSRDESEAEEGEVDRE